MVSQIGLQLVVACLLVVLHFVVRKKKIQIMQQPTPLRPVQPEMIIDIAGAKWYHQRLRRGCPTARASPPGLARTIARTIVRAALGAIPLGGRRCLVDYLTKRGRI